jgi:hypothetical protein
MATYDYQVAKTVLTDVEKDRILCIYLNRRPDGSVSDLVSSHAKQDIADTCRSTGKELPSISEAPQ